MALQAQLGARGEAESACVIGGTGSGSLDLGFLEGTSELPRGRWRTQMDTELSHLASSTVALLLSFCSSRFHVRLFWGRAEKEGGGKEAQRRRPKVGEWVSKSWGQDRGLQVLLQGSVH
jgi:hypothetical protein